MIWCMVKGLMHAPTWKVSGMGPYIYIYSTNISEFHLG